MSVTIAVSTTTTRTQVAEELEYANPPQEPAQPIFTNLRQVRQVFRQAVGRDQTSGDTPDHPFRGGPPVRNLGGPGGPQGPRGLGDPLAAPQQSIAMGNNMKPSGALPRIFNSTRERAEDFIEEVLA